MATEIKLNVAKVRRELTPRTNPYWSAIRNNRYLGFRLMTAGSTGSWVAKVKVAGKPKEYGLGAFDDMPEGERYDAALAAANRWFSEVDRTEVAGLDIRASSRKTLREATDDFVATTRAKHGDVSADDARRRLDRFLAWGTWADKPLAKLTTADFKGFMKWFSELPTTQGGKAYNSTGGRKRAPATINREVAPLRATLNDAYEAGHVATDVAWKVPLKTISKARKSRGAVSVIPLPKRAKLLQEVDALDPALGRFMRAMLIAPIRPKALAELTVADYNKARHQLLIAGGEEQTDKGHDARWVRLPDDERSKVLFREAASAKLPTALLFPRHDGSGWNKDAWKYVVKPAVAAAGLPSNITMYSLRHSRITDLLSNPEVPPMRVAQLAGTSMRMLELNYAHLLEQDEAKQALAIPGY